MNNHTNGITSFDFFSSFFYYNKCFGINLNIKLAGFGGLTDFGCVILQIKVSFTW
jgi:hypothetical protein